MTIEEIRVRIAQGEDSRTQFKRGPIGVSKLATELAAFSNAEGGAIFFGVDDEGTVIGLDKAEKKALDKELSNAANDNVRPSVYPRTEFHTIDGKQILVVNVPEGVSKPYADKMGNFWTKSGPDKRRITAREELQRLLQASLLIHADELPVPKTSASDVDLYHLGEFLEKVYGISASDVLTPGKIDLPQKLQNLGFLTGSQLTLAGLMLFGKDPQRYVPVNMVKAVAFVGNSPAGTQYRDSEDIKGSLRDMYKATMNFITRNLHHVQAGRDFNTLGELEIPEGAIQELVVNMFLHRDYFVSSPWRVMIFDDRVELVSPGSLPHHLDIEKIKAGVSVVRNPLIFSFATREMPYRGLGTGVMRAIELGAKVSFVSDRELNVFKSVIRREPVNGDETVNETVHEPVNGDETVNETVNEPVNCDETVNETVHEPVNETVNQDDDLLKSSMEQVLQIVKNEPGVRRPQLLKSIKASRATLTRAIVALQAAHKIEFRGAPKNGGYYCI
jgi:ATP-dependent DNA helicase RecG